MKFRYISCLINENSKCKCSTLNITLTLRLRTVNCVFLQCMQTFASESGTHTAAWTSTAFLPLFLNKSSMHLFICAIHSCFSVDVAAYTANDLEAVRINQPFLNS